MEMEENIILYSLIGIAVSLALLFLTKSTDQNVSVDADGFYNLRMNKFYGIIGVVAILIGVLFGILMPLREERIDSGLIFGIVLMLVIFCGTGIPCLMYYRNHRVSFDNKSIKVINVYGNRKEIQWSDISDIKFRALSGLLVIYTSNESVKLHQHLVGLGKFMGVLETKTKWTREELRIPIGE